MNFRITALVFSLLFVLASAGASLAQPGPRPGPRPGPEPGPSAGGVLQKVTPDQMVQILNSAGFPSEIKKSENTQFIISQMFQGAAGVVVPAGCDRAGCSLVLFLVSLGKETGVDLNWTNAWNSNKPFVVAQLAQDGSLIFAMWTHLYGGVTAENLKVSAQVFVQVVNSSSDFQPGK